MLWIMFKKCLKAVFCGGRETLSNQPDQSHVQSEFFFKRLSISSLNIIFFGPKAVFPPMLWCLVQKLLVSSGSHSGHSGADIIWVHAGPAVAFDSHHDCK